MKRILTVAWVLITSAAAVAQKGADTVVVELAKTSRVVFTIKDKSDLEQLKQYDFQALFNDILGRLENKDSVVVIVDPIREEPIVTYNVPESSETWASEDNYRSHRYDYEDDNDDDDRDRHYDRRGRHRGTSHTFNVDLGINSYVENGKFPDEAGRTVRHPPVGLVVHRAELDPADKREQKLLPGMGPGRKLV